MGNIRAAIALYDGVTSPLQSMHKAMGVVLNTFEAMQQASGRAVDTAAIREAREEWAKAGTAFDTIEENIRNANNEQQNFNNSIRGGSNSANGLLSIIKKVAIAAGGIAGSNKALNISDKLASTKARLNLLVDDGGSVEALEQKIMASAQRSRSVYFDTASAVAKLGLNAGNAFDGNMDQVIAFMEQVNKQFVIGGATAQEQSNAMIQLTQAMAAGALRGEELNSILDGAPGIARAIEKYMGIAEGSIKTVAQEGKVTAEVVKNAMFAMADETNAKFDSMPKTWAQIWAGMKNRALSMFAPILTKINQIANSTKFQQVTTALINGLAGVANIASSVLDILISIASVIVDNWSWIQPIIMGIVAAMLIYNGVALATNIIMGIQATAKAVHAAATAMEAGATFTATVAQQGLNAALLACPLTWIILLIIAVIAAIYAACAAVAKFTGIANSGFGVICGGIMVVIAFFKNLGLSVANIALGIWNALGACASNIGTAFHNVISNVQGWFYNLLSTALTVVAGICEALNKLPFVEFDYSGITNKASEYVLYDDAGKLTLKNINTMKLNLLIDEETGENFSYESSIDEQTYNKIKLAYNDEKTGKRELFIAQDGAKMNQWGVLQYFEEVQTKTGASAKADALLKLYDQKTRKLTIQNAFGDVRVRAGSAVVVALNLGDIVTNNYMVVNKVTHTFRGDEHMMELDLIGGEFIA